MDSSTREIKYRKPDVVCLQNVQRSFWEWFKKELGAAEYQGDYRPETGPET